MQKPEKIIISDLEYNLNSDPFRAYLNLRKIKDIFHVKDKYLSRGYLGKWEILDNKLYLKRLESSTGDRGILSIMAHLSSGGKIFFEWYSGPLYIPLDKKISDGYFDICSSYKVLILKKGILDEIIDISIGDKEISDISLREKIRDQDFLNRTIEALESNDIYYLGDLLMMKEVDFLMMRNLGRKSSNEVITLSRKLGLCDDWGKKILWDDFQLQNEVK